MRRPHPPLGILAGLVAALLLISGCATLQSVPLPGLVSGPTYDVSAVFPSALGLPEQAAVRYGGATIGEVTAVTTQDYHAIVAMRVVRSATIPADVHAEIRLTSPMGESYVELREPAGQHRATGDVLRDGSRIGLAATSQAPSATDLLASVSTLVTGGSFADMKVIITELNKALTGNAPHVRSVISRLGTTLTHLNQHTAAFDTALTALDRTARRLAGDRALIGKALDAIDPAVRTLSGQRKQIVALLARVRELGAIATPTIDRVRAPLTTVLRDLGPILDTLTRNADTFDPIFRGIRDFGRASNSAGYGQFANFDLTAIIDPSDLNIGANLGADQGVNQGAAGGAGR